MAKPSRAEVAIESRLRQMREAVEVDRRELVTLQCSIDRKESIIAELEAIRIEAANGKAADPTLSE